MPLGQDMAVTGGDEFRPLPSFGWLWSLGLAVLMVGTLVFTAVAIANDPSEEMPVWGWVVLYGVTVPLAVFFAALAASFPLMRYELGAEEVVLRYGPLLTYRIPFEEVVSIERRDDLRASMLSSVRWPGLALWDVPYVGEGRIHMCSTRVNHDVVLIETRGRRYGVSPVDVERFMDALSARSHLLSGRRS